MANPVEMTVNNAMVAATNPLAVSPIVAGADATASNPLPVSERGSFLNIAGAATIVVKSGAGILHRIQANKKIASGVITIYDNTAASGTKIGTITNPAVLLDNSDTFVYGCAFSTGLTVVTSAADDLTVVYI